MIRSVKVPILVVLAGLTLAGCGTREALPAPVPATPAPDARAGYLSADSVTAMGLAAPAYDPAQHEQDRHALAALLAPAGTPRHYLAQAHAEVNPALALGHFDCVLGTRLTSSPHPALTRLFQRALRDAATASEAAKGRAHRPRPFVQDPSIVPCVRIDAALAASASHPSGHAVVGDLYGEIVAALAPDRAEAARRIGREIGLSRTACGLHWPSDVAAGQALGQTLFQAMVAEPDFQADLAEARRELDTARATSPGEAIRCAEERLAIPLSDAD